MIIRKPYAFLIRNFRKIHIVLLLLSLFVAYKLFDVSKFVSDFMKLGTYDLYQDPVSNHITLWLQIAIFLLFIGSLAILFLLRYKNKQWKIYLIPIIEYLALFFVLSMIKSFFANYTNDVETTDLRLSRDLLVIFILIQIPAIITFFIRVFNLDKNRFAFNTTTEIENLSEKDREEVEINIDIDKDSFIRGYKKAIRNLNYFYIEHKIICTVAAIVLIVLVLGTSFYSVFVVNRSYKEGEVYSANGYNIEIKNSYFTDKDYAGNIISKKSNFVIVSLKVTNNLAPRTIDLENFHLKNGVSDYTTERKTYEKEFVDLGKSYTTVKELKRGESISFIIVYKVDKKLKKNRFVLYYQEDGGILRKIKLNIEDLSKMEKVKKLSLGDNLKIEIINNPDTISFDSIDFVREAEYTYKYCSISGCEIIEDNFAATNEFKMLQLDFGSKIYDSKTMMDFLQKYGKIIYKDKNGEDKELKIENAIGKNNIGKTLFIKVPKTVDDNTKIAFDLKVRNKEYNYELN